MRKDIQSNLRFVDVLNGWDPFHMGYDSYETEIADTIRAIHELNDCSELARIIQRIYEFSFEKMIPLESCLKIANELLVIKAIDSCSI